MLELTKRPYGELLVITLRGDIDVYAAQEIKSFFVEARLDKFKYYLVNFEQVGKLNYAAVQNINGPVLELMTVGEVSLCGVPTSIERMVKNTAFYTKCTVYDNKKEALAEILSSSA